MESVGFHLNMFGINLSLIGMARLLSRVKCGKVILCIVTVFALVIALILLGNIVQHGIEILETERLAMNNTLITFRLSYQWGMGNEMFALASTYGIMRSNQNPDHLLCVDRNTFILKVFRLENLATCSADDLVRYLEAEECRQGACAVYDPSFRSLSVGRHVVVGRFRQSWRYFKSRENEIRQLFTFKDNILKSAHDVLTRSIESHFACRGCSREVIKVGLHVRMGSIVESQILLEKGYKVSDTAFLNRAMQFYEERFRNNRTIFVVCSDSIDWCYGALQNHSSVVFVATGLPELDMAVLSLCDNSIVTVGTFGWWAAWLANGTTVYYKDWPRKESLLAATTRHEDYFPPKWIGL